MISYDAGAASYDLLSGRWSRLYVPTLLAEAGLATGHRVLDVATGTDEAATLAGSRVGTTGRVIGIDVSAPMLRIAASKVAKQAVSLSLMDGQTLAHDLPCASGLPPSMCRSSASSWTSSVATSRISEMSCISRRPWPMANPSSDFSLERGSPRFVSRGRPAHIDSHRSRSIGSRSRPVGDATGSCS